MSDNFKKYASEEYVNKKIANIPQSDWNQNDETAIDYVKNRTHWKEEKITDTDIISEMTVNIPEDNDYATLSEKCPILVVGNTYTVILNGVEYHCVARAVDDYVVLGNETVWGGIDEGNGEPFAIDSYTHGEICLNVSIAGDYTIRIFHREQQSVVHQLDKKYIPDSLKTHYIDEDKVVFRHNLIDFEESNGEYRFSILTSFCPSDKEYTIIACDSSYIGRFYSDDYGLYFSPSDFSSSLPFGMTFYDHESGYRLDFTSSQNLSGQEIIILEENGLKCLDSMYIPRTIARTTEVNKAQETAEIQGNMLQSNPNEVSYVRGKTHYDNVKFKNQFTEYRSQWYITGMTGGAKNYTEIWDSRVAFILYHFAEECQFSFISDENMWNIEFTFDNSGNRKITLYYSRYIYSAITIPPCDMDDGEVTITYRHPSNTSDGFIVQVPDISEITTRKLPERFISDNIARIADVNTILETKVTELAIPLPSIATVGQTLRISEVDENGKVTAVEAVDTQSSNLTLTDETTGKKYKLTVSDGNLTMTEVVSE